MYFLLNCVTFPVMTSFLFVRARTSRIAILDLALYAGLPAGTWETAYALLTRAYLLIDMCSKGCGFSPTIQHKSDFTKY